jgi:hypothetical protein
VVQEVVALEVLSVRLSLRVELVGRLVPAMAAQEAGVLPVEME